MVIQIQTICLFLIQDDCEKTIKSIMKTHLQISREIPMTKVVRLWNGPSFRGFKPVLVAFQVSLLNINCSVK